MLEKRRCRSSSSTRASIGRPSRAAPEWEAAQIADSLRAASSAVTVGDSVFSPVIAARGLAEYYAWTGNAEESLAWLDRAYAISPEGEDFRVIASGLYDKVRNDPRLQAGLQRARTQIHDRVQRARLGVRLK